MVGLAVCSTQQFAAGEQPPGTVKPIGWDYATTQGGGSIAKYVIDTALVGGSYVALTVAWDRAVTHTDTNENGKWDPGEPLTPVRPPTDPIANLGLHILPKDATDLAQSKWDSWSMHDNVQHIFYQLPGGDAEYEIWVRQNPFSPENQAYALAWWTFPIIPPTPV